ncbi:MAG TPA: CopD family protein, partial [Actinomycetaceae bacterium]|nr:CopD family protein [Actinomycetaceae bacterium]
MTRRGHRWMIAAVPVALLALVLGLLSTGAARAGMLVDPGALVRWGLPVATVLVRAAATVTIGAFAVAALVLAGPVPGTAKGARVRIGTVAAPSPDEGTAKGARVRTGTAAAPSPAWRATVRIGTVAALVWVIVQVTFVVFTYASVWGRSPAEATFGDELWFFLTRTELGLTLGWEMVFAVVVSLCAVATSGMVMALWTAILGAIALVPVALTGHAAGAEAHNLAVSSQWLHLVPLAMWAGGLAVLVAVYRLLGGELTRAATRYSGLAVWTFALVGLSGVFASVIRLQSPADLVLHPYGRLLLVKIVLFSALGWAGWLHRNRTIPQLGERPGLFLRLATVEVVVMG